jgi:hypothetical protein
MDIEKSGPYDFLTYIDTEKEGESHIKIANIQLNVGDVFEYNGCSYEVKSRVLRLSSCFSTLTTLYRVRVLGMYNEYE